MGTTLAVIVLLGPPAESDGAVAAWLAASGWQEAEGAAATCTTFRVGPTALAVGGEPVPPGDPELLRELTAELSRQAGGLAVGAGVEDSDVLTLVVAGAGSTHQALQLGPAVRLPASTPDPIWARLLAPGRDLGDLAAAWAAPATYAEEVLARTATLCGWEAGLLEPGGESARPVVRARHLRRIGGAAGGGGGGAGARLGHAGGDPRVTARAGGEARLQIVAHSVAGPGTRLSVAAWGPALDAGLIEPRTVELVSGHPAAPRERVTGTFTRSGAVAAAHLAVAIPPGIADQAAAIRGVGAAEGVRRWLATRLEATIIARAVHPGAEELHLGMVPDEAGERAATWSLVVEIAP